MRGKKLTRDNLQLLITALAAFLPTLTVLVAMLQNNSRFNSIDKRMDDMKELWRAALHRVEEVLDARLKHIEENRAR